MPVNGSLVAPSIVSAAFWPTFSEEMSAWVTRAWAIRSLGKPMVARAVLLLTLLPRPTFHDSMTAPLGTQTNCAVVISPVWLRPWAACQSSSAVSVERAEVAVDRALK